MSAMDLIAALRARSALLAEDKTAIENLIDRVASMEDPAIALRQLNELSAAVEAELRTAPLLTIQVRLRL